MARIALALRVVLVGLTVWVAVRFFNQTTYSVSTYVDMWAPAIGVIATVDLVRPSRTRSSHWYTGGLLVAALLFALYAAGKDRSATDTRVSALCIYTVAAVLVVVQAMVRRPSTTSTVTVSPSVT